MKHIGMDITEYFSKTAIKVFEMNRCIQGMLDNTKRLNKMLDIPTESNIDSVAEKLMTGFNGFGTWCLMTKSLI